MSGNPLHELTKLGQSVWLDDLHRGLIDSGELARLIREDGISGLTSNPAILSQAIRGRAEYSAAARTAHARGESARTIHEALAIADVQAAADLFRPAHEASEGREGYVSIEVSPRLADDAQGTVTAARELWAKIARPNVMIKVPGTTACLPAVRELLSGGIHVNVTLLFSAARYAAVLETFLAALEARLARGEALRAVASVASFFVSRIDTAVDAELDGLAASGPCAALAGPLRGRAACACAARAYDTWLEVVGSGRWARLAHAGARMQRLLWAST